MMIVEIVIGLAFYMLPALISRSRGAVNNGGIVLVNLVFGWTGIGWLGALLWSCTAETHDQVLMRDFLLRHDAKATAIPQPKAASESLKAGRAVGRLLRRVGGASGIHEE